jgi:Icc protein
MDSTRPAEPPSGRVSDEQLAWLDGLCRVPDDRPLVVAVHHNVLPVGVPWWDDYMRMVNGEDFHRALLPARDRIRGVFFGHVHQNVDTVRDGIAYFSALSSWYQLHNYPGQVESEEDRFAGPGFSVVTVTREQASVRRHRFIVDSGSLTN